MKKIISVLLAAVMLLSLAALVGCAGCNDTGDGDTTTTGDPAGSTPITPGDITFTTVNETVYATEGVNIRSAMVIDSANIVGGLKAGEQITRIGYHSEWSKVIFNGQECYIKSDYLTTEKDSVTTAGPAVGDDEFTVVDETVYAYYDEDEDGECDPGAKINLRAEARSNATIKFELPRGTELKRVGVMYDEGSDTLGWSKVIYNGETVYCRNSCLSTTNPGPGPEVTGTTTTAAQ